MQVQIKYALVISIYFLVSTGTAQLLEPSDFEYRGAFRLPENDVQNYKTWAYGGSALAFYPEGDPKGEIDGYPGSLFGTGHLYELQVSEISIPRPVISAEKDPDKLHFAKTLQPFASITGGIRSAGDQCIVAGLEYLPAQGNQNSGKLYFVQGHHWMEFDDALGKTTQPTLWWADIDLSTPNPSGPWRLGTTDSYNTCGYIMEIPAAWAKDNKQNFRLAIGNHREGRSGSQGPTLYACAPWLSGNPPAAKSSIGTVELLHYGDVGSIDTFINYRHSDTWGGAAWVECNGKSAVLLTGSKGLGKEYYDVNCQGKGWYCDRYACEILLYNPTELAQIAAGTRKPYQIQPYASLNVESLMFGSGGCRARIDGTAYDRKNNLLYIFESTAIKWGYPIIHVWKIKALPSSKIKEKSENTQKDFNCKPISIADGVMFSLDERAVTQVYNLKGEKVRTINSQTSNWITLDKREASCPRGLYIVKVQIEGKTLSKKFSHIR